MYRGSFRIAERCRCPSEFRDSSRENIGRLIEQKQKGKPVSATAQPKRAPVIDLMEALKRSMAATPATGRKARNHVGKRSKKGESSVSQRRPRVNRATWQIDTCN